MPPTKPQLDEFERGRLVLDILRACNLSEKIWQTDTPQARVCKLLHHITDPRIEGLMIISRRSALVSVLKQSKELWDRVKGYLIPEIGWSDKCASCKHDIFNHKYTGRWYSDPQARDPQTLNLGKCEQEGCNCKKGLIKSW